MERSEQSTHEIMDNLGDDDDDFDDYDEYCPDK